jgi:hypothetical protein
LRAFATAEIMDGWDWALLGIAGYVATIALVRLMVHRRNQVVEELVEEAELKRRQARKPASSASSPRSGRIA